MVSAMFDVTDVQGNILRGYRQPRVRHLILAVTEPADARASVASVTERMRCRTRGRR